METPFALASTSQAGWLGRLQLRACSEHIPIVRDARACQAPNHPCHLIIMDFRLRFNVPCGKNVRAYAWIENGVEMSEEESKAFVIRDRRGRGEDKEAVSPSPAPTSSAAPSPSARAPNPTPSTAAAPVTVAFTASATAPNMIGDFFGGVGSSGAQPVLLHPESGNELEDHRDHAVWLGEPLPLNLSVLR